jgi:hypothetical protein
VAGPGLPGYHGAMKHMSLIIVLVLAAVAVQQRTARA